MLHANAVHFGRGCNLFALCLSLAVFATLLGRFFKRFSKQLNMEMKIKQFSKTRPRLMCPTGTVRHSPQSQHALSSTSTNMTGYVWYGNRSIRRKQRANSLWAAVGCYHYQRALHTRSPEVASIIVLIVLLFLCAVTGGLLRHTRAKICCFWTKKRFRVHFLRK